MLTASMKPSERQQASDDLITSIQEIYEQSGQIYGSPRIHVELLNRGKHCSLGRVKRPHASRRYLCKVG